VLGWTQISRWSTRGVGRIAGDELAGLGAGPVARAAGLAEDVRLEDPAYRELGFEPILGDGADAATRLRLRLAEAAQSFDLAARAGDRHTTLRGRVESPRGRLEPGSGPSARLLTLMSSVLRETEWGDAVTTIVSLDIDLEEAVLARRAMRAAAVA
jgi:Ni,Fe-hydrogenase III large subunit